MIKWETGLLDIPLVANMVEILDKAGEDGWEPWGIIGVDNNKQVLRIAIKRISQK